MKTHSIKNQFFHVVYLLYDFQIENGAKDVRKFSDFSSVEYVTEILIETDRLEYENHYL